ALALLGFLKVRRIRGPRQTIESVKETRSALTPSHDKAPGGAKQLPEPHGRLAKPGNGAAGDPSGW
ncbi:MAG TPA: phage holin family protein, partial [Mycobacterium sp.]|nr:phage holin family protein [Mycobacterium sp.]